VFYEDGYSDPSPAVDAYPRSGLDMFIIFNVRKTAKTAARDLVVGGDLVTLLSELLGHIPRESIPLHCGQGGAHLKNRVGHIDAGTRCDGPKSLVATPQRWRPPSLV